MLVLRRRDNVFRLSVEKNSSPTARTQKKMDKKFLSSSLTHPVHARRVDLSDFVFSLSSHRHSYLGLVFSSRFLDS